MALPNNILQNVQTYNKAVLAYLQNSNCFLSTANKRFSNFEKANPANLGDTITFDKPVRVTATAGLTAQFQGIEQRVQELTVDKSYNVSLNISAQELIFNLYDYMDRVGKSATQELGAVIESDLASICQTTPYRFFGDGVNPIDSYTQLATALKRFSTFGADPNDVKGYLPDVVIPKIVGSGLNQFVPDDNKRLRNSWELGSFSRCTWYESNLLKVHTAGSEGQAGSTLTVVSTTKDANGAVTAITFSGTSASSDADSVKEFDRFEFNDNVSGQPNLRFLTFYGHQVSAARVQFKATADAASTGGSQVTVSVDPPLQANAGRNQNINNAIVAGMTVSVLPTHRVGMIQSGNQFYCAMPPLPDCDPFSTSVETDKDTGASLRMYTGSQFGQNKYGTVHDVIWGKTLVSDNAMALIFPYND